MKRKYREGAYRQGAKWLGNSMREDDINEGITYLRALQNEMQIVYCTIINQGNRRRMVDIIEGNVLDVEGIEVEWMKCTITDRGHYF